MKVLRVISSVNPAAGGPINGLVNSSKELLKLGHEVSVLSLDNPQSSWVEGFDFPLITFKASLGTYSYSSSFYKWLKLNVNKYDVVLIHGLWQFHSYATSTLCLKNRVPFVVFTHGMLDPWFNKNQRIKTLKKKIYWSLFERHVINNANSVLFTSEEECKLARTPFSPYGANERVVSYGCPKIKADKIKLVKNFNKRFPELIGKQVGLFLSRIDHKKGIDLLIDAMATIDTVPSDFILAIAGPDNVNLRVELEAQIKNLGIVDRIVWLGMLSGDLKWGAFYAADFFILPSHQENFGIVVAEALSTSTPVLITNKVNIWREISSSGSGFVANDDVRGISLLLKRWFSLNKQEKAKMAVNAAQCYSEKFSIEAAAVDLERELLNVIEAKSYE